MVNFYFENAEDLIDGIECVKEDLYFDIVRNAEDADVIVSITENDANALEVKRCDRQATIIFGQGKVKFFRGLMLLSEGIHEGKNEFSTFETPSFKDNGIFLDVSRNAALNIISLKYFIRQSAIMGLNTISLYLEDMYEIEGRPYFGYMRGRYTKKEIRNLCAYGEKLGVELLPVIETISHLSKFLGYNSSEPFRCTAGTLLVGEQATYDLIEDMIKSIKDCFYTDKVFIGGDEAFDANQGAYGDRNSDRPLEDVFFEHMNKAYEIATKYGLKPYMYNDMYFYFRHKGPRPLSYYYCSDDVYFEDELKKKLPEGMGKVFWNYQEEDEDKMARMMSLSKELGGDTKWFGAVRMWQSLCMQYTPTIKNAIVGTNACKRSGIDRVSLCTYEDSGLIPHFLALPAMLVYAQLDYGDKYDEEDIDRKVKFLYGVNYIDFLEMERADYVHENKDYELATKFLLYNDPLIGLLDKEIDGLNLRKYYHNLLCDYEDRGNGTEPINLSFAHFKGMLKILELKADFGVRLKAAYDKKDKETLYKLANDALIIKERYDQFMSIEREMFTKYYRGCGFEKFEIRSATLRARFETMRYRILAYLNGELDSIDELEQAKLRYDHCRFECPNDKNIFFGTSFAEILSEA